MGGAGPADGLEYGPVRAEEVDALDQVVSQALLFPPHLMRLWIERLGAANFRVVRRDGRIAAGLGIVPMGHWLGGASVPTAGITAVGVAPEHRGGGVGIFMLRRLLEEAHAAGYPLSTLYPSTFAFYRRAGYERAGVRATYELPLGALDPRAPARDPELTVGPVGEAEYGALREVYAETARRTAGNLDRPDFVWWRILEPYGQTARAYQAVRGERAEGYVVFTQTGREDPLRILDLRMLTRAAGERLLAFLAGHRSMVDCIVWSGGGATDPLVALLPEQRHKQLLSFDWLLRIVDVRGALAARGYPPGLDAELHLDVRDDLLPANNRRFVLTLSDGRGAVREGGEGRVRLDIRGLAALYTGFQTPGELHFLGLLDGPARDLALAGLVFAGPQPWVPDMF